MTKQIVFYEVNDAAPHQYTFKSELARQIFDSLNNAGAISDRVIHQRSYGTKIETDKALTELLNARMIVRRTGTF